MKRRKPTFDVSKEVRSIARERVGPVKASRVVVPKTLRKKPKHKKTPGDLDPRDTGR